MFASSKSPLSVLIATATSWKGIDGGGLRVYSGEKLVAEFAAGAWVAVVVNGVNPADYAELASKLVGQFKDGGK